MRTSYFLYILFFSVFSFNSISAQKKIEIKYSGFLTFNELEYPGAKILTRDDSEQVHIFHEGTNMWCDKAYYYSNENFIEAFGNVKMIQGDTINMASKYVEYDGATKLAFASGDVILKDPNSTITTDTLYFDRDRQQAFYRSHGTVEKDTSGTITSKIGRYYMKDKKYKFVEDVVLTNPDAVIKSNYFDFYSESGHAYLFGPSTITTEESVTYCEKGFYDTKNKIGHAMKNAKIDYDLKEIVGDSLYFDNNNSFASATNNIKVTDTINNSIVKGHYAEIFKAKDSIFITKRAYAITVQEKDSIYIHGDTLMVTGKPEKRITRVFRNVKLFKSDLSGKADSIHVNHETGLTQLINISNAKSSGAFTTKRKPIIWNLANQMTGDTIHLQSDTKKDKLDSLIVFNNAFLISKDTLSDGFNQINGKKLVGLFDENNEIYQVDIIKNAQSIYYMRNDKGELVGIDKSKSGLIKILFENKAIEQVIKLNQVDGKIYPESQFPKNEKIFKGFDWREEERPMSVDDLFKDDPPLKLPTIKGLEDYVPEDDFFDDSISDRIALSKRRFLIKNSNYQDDNLLKFNNEFENSIWSKRKVKVLPNSSKSPQGKMEAYKVIGKDNDKVDGYLVQTINKNKGKFMFSIWAKGKGEIRIRLQEGGGNYTNYSTTNIILTNKWKNYKVKCNKDKDGNNIRGVISGIHKNDNFFLWNAKLTLIH